MSKQNSLVDLSKLASILEGLAIGSVPLSEVIPTAMVASDLIDKIITEVEEISEAPVSIMEES